MGIENLEYHNSPKFSDTQNVCCNHLIIMPPTLKKWGTYWFRLVRVCVFMFEISS